jgi:hypothetical protein
MQARLIRDARGISGANLDYLISTLRHLAELGIRERELERLLGRIAPHAAKLAGPRGQSSLAAALVRQGRSGRLGPRLKLDQRRRFLYRQRLAGGWLLPEGSMQDGTLEEGSTVA